MRYITGILLSLTVTFSLAACTTAEAIKSDSSSTSNLTAQNEQTIEGKVTRVNGNEIELDLGSIKTVERKNPEGSADSAPSETPPNGQTPSEGISPPNNASSGANGRGSRPNGDIAGAEGLNGTMNFSGGTTIELNGESQTIEIPVGTPVYMTVRGNSSQVDFTRISKENILRVKLSDDNRVLSVTVVS